MASFKEILPSDIKTSTSYLSQLIDVTQDDISGSVSRRHYQHFVTGSSINNGVTSSLFQTVYDSDFTLQTSNPIFDITVGVNPTGEIVADLSPQYDSAGKALFASETLMMREKMDIYRSFAQTLLGSAEANFVAPFDSIEAGDVIEVPIFFAFKRLFARDSIKRETFALKFLPTLGPVINGSNLQRPADTSNVMILTDIGSATNRFSAFGGQVGNIVNASNTDEVVGLMFYDRGVLVLDLEKITDAYQSVTGRIDTVETVNGIDTLTDAPFVPDFIVRASIDNIVDHLASSRFGTGALSAMTFKNQTNINSTLIFCRAAADEFNYSSHPTFTDDDGRIVCIEQGSEDIQTSFTFITGVGLYDANDTLLAVAKTSRPIEKNNERDLTIRVRLDF